MGRTGPREGPGRPTRLTERGGGRGGGWLVGTLAGVGMGLELAGIPHDKGGVTAAMNYLAEAHKAAPAGTFVTRS